MDALACVFVDPCQKKQVVPILTPVTKFDGRGFFSKKVEMKESRYLVSGWAKVQPLDYVTIHNIIGNGLHRAFNESYHKTQS